MYDLPAKPSAEAPLCPLSATERGDAVRLTPANFMTQMIGDLTAILEASVGPDDVERYIETVGSVMSRWIDELYRAELRVDHFDVETLAKVFVDLKSRIDGDFHIESLSPTRILLLNYRCPFRNQMHGRTALCKMTASVFGQIAAKHCGYANVALHETLAAGDDRCRVVIDLEPTFKFGERENREFIAAPH